MSSTLPELSIAAVEPLQPRRPCRSCRPGAQCAPGRQARGSGAADAAATGLAQPADDPGAVEHRVDRDLLPVAPGHRCAGRRRAGHAAPDADAEHVARRDGRRHLGDECAGQRGARHLGRRRAGLRADRADRPRRRARSRGLDAPLRRDRPDAGGRQHPSAGHRSLLRLLRPGLHALLRLAGRRAAGLAAGVGRGPAGGRRRPRLGGAALDRIADRLFAASALAIVLYGTITTTAIASGAWFRVRPNERETT